MSDGQTKQFGKGQRLVPAQKAQKWYPVDDESQPKKVSERPRTTCKSDTYTRTHTLEEDYEHARFRSDRCDNNSRRILFRM